MKEFHIVYRVGTTTRGFGQVIEYDIFTVVAPDGEEIESFGGSAVSSEVAKQQAKAAMNSYNVTLFRQQNARLEGELAVRHEQLRRVSQQTVILINSLETGFPVTKDRLKTIIAYAALPESEDEV